MGVTRDSKSYRIIILNQSYIASLSTYDDCTTEIGIYVVHIRVHLGGGLINYHESMNSMV